MGNKYSGVKQQVIKNRDEQFKKEIEIITQHLAKSGLSEEKISVISSMNCKQIVQQLNSQRITSEEIVLACCDRTAKIGKRFNLVTQTNFRQALEQAAICDSRRNIEKKKNWTFDCGEQMDLSKYFPPLFGVPISIKDAFDMKKLRSTVGCLSNADIKQEDSPLIQCFKNSGMMPFVRTNVPQLLGNYQTVNSLWGRSINPLASERTPGGSSGGQAGLICSNCSYLGVGSDSGGSIRIPSQFCGIYGLKSSSGRVSQKYNTQVGERLYCPIPLCIGPLARSSEDLALFMKVVTTQEFYGKNKDPYTKIIPFNDKEYLKFKNTKFRIGYIKRFNCSQTCPTSQRALNQVVQHLQQQGHELVQIQLPNEKQMISDFVKQMFATGGQSLKKVLRGQQPTPQQKGFLNLAQMWKLTHFLACKIMQRYMPRLNQYGLKHARPINTLQYQNLIGRISQYRGNWVNYWKQNKLDLVISPGIGFPALKHGQSLNIGIAVSYAFLWNLLDMSAAVMPVTTVRQDEQYFQSVFEDMQSKQIKQSMKNSVGLPIGVQIIGLPYQQERVLGLMSKLQELIKFGDNANV